MISSRSVLVLSAAVILASCAPKPSEVLLDTEKTPPDVLLARVREQSSRVKSLTGRGIVSFDTPEISGSASFEMNLKKPDSLLVLLEGPLGIDVGTLFLSREKFVAYNSFENTVVTGNPESSRIRSLIPLDLSYDQIVDAFAGMVSVPSDGENITAYRIEDEQFFLESTCGENICSFWIDPQYLLVTRYERRTGRDVVTLEAHLSSFANEESTSAPKRISINLPQQNRQVTIAYNSLNLNPAETDFRYKIPSNARKLNTGGSSDGAEGNQTPR